MALQGTIDTFALDDVLRLVASTGKTGRLALRGSRGEGALVIRDGLVLDGEVSTDARVGDLHELVFELLRFEDGDFVFEAVAVDGLDDAEALDVDGLIHGASELLGEWREIERVVPGPSSLVTLRPETPGGSVKIDPSQWSLIASVGAGAGVDELSERLDLSHLATGRLLRSLVDSGLLDISEAPAPVAPVAPAAPVYPPPGVAPVEVPPVAEQSWATEQAWAPEPAAVSTNGNGHGEVDADILFDELHRPAPVSDAASDPDAGRAAVEVEVAPVIDAAEFARRLAELPPRAAKAVAAAARATNAEERQAALAELDGTGEEVDHEVLLQLLGPVES